jgi:hypothetical protein
MVVLSWTTTGCARIVARSSAWKRASLALCSLRIFVPFRRRNLLGNSPPADANIAQGGRGEAVSLMTKEENLALRAAVGVKAAGVDLLPGPDGEGYVLEVNAVPGWRALAPVARVDIAQHLIRFATDARTED